MFLYTFNGEIQCTAIPLSLSLSLSSTRKLIGAVALLTVANVATAEIISNGSFELPPITPNTYQVGSPSSWNGGWAIMNGSVLLPGGALPLAQDGQQWVDIGNLPNTPFSQSFAISTQGQYQLSWYDNTGVDYGLGWDGQKSPYSVSVNDSSFQSVASGNFDAAHNLIWQNRSLSFNLSPGTYTLVFTSQGTTGYGYDTHIDNVSIAAVPEPEEYLMMLLGSGMVAFQVKRKQKAK